jgi:hypothetical protein
MMGPFPSERIRKPVDHPHTGATYEIREADGGGFVVKVSIPDRFPTLVSGFPAKADAIAWTVNHKKLIARGEPLKRTRTFRRRQAAQ